MVIVVDCKYCPVDVKKNVLRAMTKAFNKPVLEYYYCSLKQVRSLVNYDNCSRISVNSYVPTIRSGDYYYAKTFINLGSL